MSTQQAESQLNYLQSLVASSIESAGKIIALNISTVRASMEQSSAAVRQVFSAKDPRDLLTLTTSTQESFESMLAYGRALAAIASATQVSLPEPAPKAAPIDVPADPVEMLPVKAKPVARVVSKVIAKPAPAKSAAAPFPAAAARPLKVSTKPVAAAAPSVEPKQLDMLTPKPKASKKK